MSRGLEVSQINLSAGPHRIVAPLVELYFDSGTLRLACFGFNVTYGATTWIRANLIIEKLKESGRSTEGLELRMDGLSTEIIALATAEPYHGRVCRLLKGYIHPDTNELVGQPRPWFAGRMRHMPIAEDNTKAEVRLQVEHYDVELGRPMPVRLNDADQQRLFPGDRGCEYAAQNSDKQVVWPSKEAQKHGNAVPNFYWTLLGRSGQG